MSGSLAYRIIGNRIVFPAADDGSAARFLSVRELKFQYELPNPTTTSGADEQTQPSAPTLTPELSHLIVDRGNSAAVMIHDKVTDEIILVRQFRPATLRENSLGDGWLVELPAGRIDEQRNPPDTPRTCAIREAREETGYEIRSPILIASILPSPGACSERIHIYYADDVMQVDKPGGVAAENENIQLVKVKRDELFRQLDAGEIADAKLLLAAQWLRLNPARNEGKPLDLRTIDWRVPDTQGPKGKLLPKGSIGIKTGAIDAIKGIDAWINTENTDMSMARIFERSVSARIRYLGAAKNLDKSIHADTIANALQRALAGKTSVKPGNVIITTSGELYRNNGVRCILHVACAEHLPGGQPNANPEAAAYGLDHALYEADNINTFWWLNWRYRPIRSILVPLIGTGQGEADLGGVVEQLFQVALRHFRERPNSRLREIYFLAYKPKDERAIKAYADRLIAEKRLETHPTSTS